MKIHLQCKRLQRKKSVAPFM